MMETGSTTGSSMRKSFPLYSGESKTVGQSGLEMVEERPRTALLPKNPTTWLTTLGRLHITWWSIRSSAPLKFTGPRPAIASSHREGISAKASEASVSFPPTAYFSPP
ncbi:MAG: hypothetical protein CMO55_01105 [Verrucomicrobiales bacterium]|nr:hypothetical protein [Verrucomicrobiales bacterium]